jgi:hypothetical protein
MHGFTARFVHSSPNSGPATPSARTTRIIGHGNPDDFDYGKFVSSVVLARLSRMESLTPKTPKTKEVVQLYQKLAGGDPLPVR